MGFSNRVRFKSVIKENKSKCFAVFSKLAPRPLKIALPLSLFGGSVGG